jgi:hypothetical protein
VLYQIRLGATGKLASIKAADRQLRCLLNDLRSFLIQRHDRVGRTGELQCGQLGDEGMGLDPVEAQALCPGGCTDNPRACEAVHDHTTSGNVKVIKQQGCVVGGEARRVAEPPIKCLVAAGPVAATAPRSRLRRESGGLVRPSLGARIGLGRLCGPGITVVG